MTRARLLSTLLFCALFCAPAFAQPQIGGGTCDSTSFNGNFQINLIGRQVASNGAISKQLQATGVANFDGQSKVTLTLTANTNAAAGQALTWSGTYSVQANCVGSINITTGNSATFTTESFASGRAFALSGTDATYAYTGSGNVQSGTCQLSTLSGIHEFNSTGSLLTGNTISGTLDIAGVLQFDGKGGLTANWTQATNSATTTITATGTYTVNSACIASATLTDTANNKYALNLIVYSTAPDFALVVSSPQLIFNGYGSAAQPSGAGGACTPSMLSGPYELTLTGRQVSSAGVNLKMFQSVGLATFDGVSKVTFALTANTNAASGTSVTWSGSYGLQSNCQGTINITTGDTATFNLVAYSINTTAQQANSFALVGTDSNYAYNATGNIQPAACSNATLSGLWNFSASGSTLSGSSITGSLDAAGVLQFDGQGNVTASWTEAADTATSPVTATGTYSVTADCRGTATLTESGSSTKSAWALTIFNAAAANLVLAASEPQVLFNGNARAALGNPGQRVLNAGSYAAGSTPAGSVFALFGLNLAPTTGQPTVVPLPGTFLNTSVTVNGEAAPLFYVSPTQINAQMPEDIPAGLATVVVKTGSSTSNAVAVVVPATATPGIIYYGNNRAVVVDATQKNTVNTTSTPSQVGDVLVAYFTGGGPVTASGPLVTGAPSPGGLSPVAGTTRVTVGGVDAVVNYIGLTPGSIGLYQANFVLPKVAAGDHPVVITIAGKASNNPVIAVAN